ncbi:hypothetical protein BRADI_1g24463v3 [Brachypodium distachyon]|uniref:Uncharacterized protein n=1 Tax=Brachypodium distachyon TaxID=15368 RepID=A0A0Q3NEH8_BRADI|nr:hypothetical protein BRADI_1g24463v3 [Brachypodium distachyon]
MRENLDFLLTCLTPSLLPLPTSAPPPPSSAGAGLASARPRLPIAPPFLSSTGPASPSRPLLSPILDPIPEPPPVPSPLSSAAPAPVLLCLRAASPDPPPTTPASSDPPRAAASKIGEAGSAAPEPARRRICRRRPPLWSDPSPSCPSVAGSGLPYLKRLTQVLMQKESHLENFNHYNSTILEYLSFCLIMLVMTSQMHTCFDTGEIFYRGHQRCQVP